MNKYEHAESSAKIFGGPSKDYESFHALIDSNKVVTPSIFGRFYLHHMDIGLPILKKVFGEKIGSKKVPAQSLLLQHLFEDYGKVLTFADDWMPAMKEHAAFLPKLKEWDAFIGEALKDPRLVHITVEQLKELEKFFKLETIMGDMNTFYFKEYIFAIFGHALGGDLAVQIIGPKFHGVWTSDVVTAYLYYRFKWADRSREGVPTLLDYEQYVPDQAWMHPPTVEQFDRHDTNQIKTMIEEHQNGKAPVKVPSSTITDKVKGVIKSITAKKESSGKFYVPSHRKCTGYD